mgnify:CR=1 FL=1
MDAGEAEARAFAAALGVHDGDFEPLKVLLKASVPSGAACVVLRLSALMLLGFCARSYA